MLLAEFDYSMKPKPSFPIIDTIRERRDMWYLKRYGLPALYWNLMLKGLVDITHPDGDDSWLLRYRGGAAPFSSDDPDSERIWWSDPGVHQNLAFAVQPDPWSGMHCWLQKVRMAPAEPGDRYGDVYVDARRSVAVTREWLDMARATTGPGGQRRPEFLTRPVKPKRRAFRSWP